jgi:hypothetical protein
MNWSHELCLLNLFMISAKHGIWPQISICAKWSQFQDPLPWWSCQDYRRQSRWNTCHRTGPIKVQCMLASTVITVNVHTAFWGKKEANEAEWLAPQDPANQWLCQDLKPGCLLPKSELFVHQLSLALNERKTVLMTHKSRVMSAAHLAGDLLLCGFPPP